MANKDEQDLLGPTHRPKAAVQYVAPVSSRMQRLPPTPTTSTTVKCDYQPAKVGATREDEGLEERVNKDLSNSHAG